MVTPEGFEPSVYSLEGCCIVQLCYEVNGSAYEIRTHIYTVKGCCPNL